MSATLNFAESARLAKHRRRKRVNAIALTLSLSAMAFGLFWLAWILIETVRLGLGGLSLVTFTEMTPPPQADSGGLANAIFGSLVMVSLATLVGTPVGVLAGIYLAEYGQKGWLEQLTRFISAVHCHRPVHLRDGGVSHEELLRPGRSAGLVVDCDPRGDSHH